MAAVTDAAMLPPLVSVRGEQESRGGKSHRSGFPFSDCCRCNRTCKLIQCWGSGVWRETTGPLGELFARSLQPLMVRSMFALCSGTELVFIAQRGLCSPSVSFGPVSSHSKSWVLALAVHDNSPDHFLTWPERCGGAPLNM